MTDGVEFSYRLIFKRGYIMNIHFEYGPKEKARLGELVEMCDVALALIHERTQLLKLLRTYSVCEERNNIFNAALKRLKNLERVSDQVRLAFCNPVGVEDGISRFMRSGRNSGLKLISSLAVRNVEGRKRSA
jgi:hypothetical protein